MIKLSECHTLSYVPLMLKAFKTFLWHPSQQLTETFRSTLCTNTRHLTKHKALSRLRTQRYALAHLQLGFLRHTALEEQRREKAKFLQWCVGLFVGVCGGFLYASSKGEGWVRLQSTPRILSILTSIIVNL